MPGSSAKIIKRYLLLGKPVAVEIHAADGLRKSQYGLLADKKKCPKKKGRKYHPKPYEGSCSNDPARIDHMLLIVGWEILKNSLGIDTPCWKMLNTWGKVLAIPASTPPCVQDAVGFADLNYLYFVGGYKEPEDKMDERTILKGSMISKGKICKASRRNVQQKGLRQEGLAQNIISWIEKANPNQISALKDVYKSLGTQNRPGTNLLLAILCAVRCNEKCGAFEELLTLLGQIQSMAKSTFLSNEQVIILGKLTHGFFLCRREHFPDVSVTPKCHFYAHMLKNWQNYTIFGSCCVAPISTTSVGPALLRNNYTGPGFIYSLMPYYTLDNYDKSLDEDVKAFRMGRDDAGPHLHDNCLFVFPSKVHFDMEIIFDRALVCDLSTGQLCVKELKAAVYDKYGHPQIPTNRSRFSSTVIGNRLFIVGGLHQIFHVDSETQSPRRWTSVQEVIYKDVWTLDLLTWTWRRWSKEGTGVPLYSTASIYQAPYINIFGGVNKDGDDTNDLLQLLVEPPNLKNLAMRAAVKMIKPLLEAEILTQDRHVFILTQDRHVFILTQDRHVFILTQDRHVFILTQDRHVFILTQDRYVFILTQDSVSDVSVNYENTDDQ
uniref:Uncharacterized protein n=1 Tax=Ditylenchus dipsaci TaxID=166011 RepID=A0A915CY05_9BILA